MIHLSVCTPTSGLLRAEYALSLAQFAMTFMTEAADPEEPRQHIVLRQYQSSSISNGREYLVRTSLDEGATHVLFIDDDMSFAPGVPIMLLRRNLPLVGCNYPIRFEGMPFSAFAPDFQTRVTTRADSPDLEEGGAVGFGMCLIAREVFEAIPQPWFPIEWDPDSCTYSTEDTPFFFKARAAGFPLMIDHAASRSISHHGSYRYRWDQPGAC
jgi:hypothetical protein